jgi:hypothetical protein
MITGETKRYASSAGTNRYQRRGGVSVQFAIVSPASGLQRWATRSRCHLVLSHVGNALYQQFYRKRSEAGDLVILDNSAYEGALNENQLLERIGLYHPKVTILPDIYGGDMVESFNLAKAFHNVWKSRLSMQWMFVPQANDIQGHFDSAERAIGELGVEWIGIPRRFGTHCLGSRPLLCAWIHEKFPNVNVHALGMLAGDVNELPLLERAQCQSIDSSAPVWRGWNGFSIDETYRWAQYGTNVDFDAAPIEGVYVTRNRLIEYNLRMCGVQINE